MKKYGVMFILFFSMLIFFSCSPKIQKYNNKVLIFWHSMGGPMGKVLNQLIKEYNATNPEYKIHPVYKGGYSSLIQSLLAGIPAHSLPDFTQAYESWTAKLIDNDIIIPIQPFFDKLPKEDQEDFFPILIKNNTFNGKLWSIPFNKSVPVMYYNKDLFEKYHLTPPTHWSPIESESEFDTVCKVLKQDNDHDGIPNQWGYACNISVMMWECFLFQAGGELVDETGKIPMFDQAPGIDAITWWKHLLDKKYAFKTQGFDFQNDFAAGHVGMIMTSCVSKYFIKNKLTFNMGIAPLPSYKRKAVVLSGTNIVIMKTTPERERGVWEFLKWLTSPEITARWSVNTNYLPLRKSAIETKTFQDALKDDPELLIPIKELDYAYFEPQNSGWYTSRNMLSETIEMILLGILPPEKALQELAEKIKPELNK